MNSPRKSLFPSEKRIQTSDIQERARRVVDEVREHKMFNVVTDATWQRYIASAIKYALDDALPDANDLDDVVRALRIEDSHITPTEAVKGLQVQLFTLQNALADILKSTPEERQDPAIWFPLVDAARAALNWVYYTESDALLQREPGTCKCGAAPINSDGLCATCADECQPEAVSARKLGSRK